MTGTHRAASAYSNSGSGSPILRKRNSPSINQFLQNNSLGLIGGGLVLSAVALQSPMIATAIAAIAMMAFLVGDQLMRGQKAFSNMGMRWQLVIIGFGVLLFLLDTSVAPAQAQFFKAAETWITTNFGKGGAGGAAVGADAIALVFNVLRALFLIYLGISLVRVVNSVRQDEDWQTIARTPLIILVTVVVADVMTTLIVGA